MIIGLIVAKLSGGKSPLQPANFRQLNLTIHRALTRRLGRVVYPAEIG